MTKEQIQWINEKVGMRDLLHELGVDIPRNGVFYCPFHDNSRTPAAKYYADSNKLWCFAEQKMYHAYDCMRKLEYSNERILAYLPEDLSDFEAKDFKLMFPIVPECMIKQSEASDSFIELCRFLFNLNELWKNRDKVECKEIK